MQRHRQIGMTLIELMVVVAVVAIIASIALPSYSAYVRRVQRSDATSVLLKIAAAQEKFYIQNNTYANQAQVAAMGLGASEHGWYAVQITAPAAPGSLVTGYTAAATPVASGPQAADKDCVSFQIDQMGGKTAQKEGGVLNTNKCWR